MIKAFLRSLEEPSRPLLGPNYWILKKMGLLLPENKIYKAFCIIVHELATFFVISQYVELYTIKSDIDQVLTNLKISMLSSICVLKANTFMYWQLKWKNVLEYVTEADKYERDSCNSGRREILSTYTRYCRRVTYFYWVLVFLTFLTVTHTPLVVFLSSSNFREQLLNGNATFPHIFSSWMPVDKYHSPGSWITVLWHVLVCAYGAGIVAAFDTTVIGVMVFFGGKLALLREWSKQMLGNTEAGVCDQEAEIRIRQLHHMYVLLIKYSRIFNSVLSPVMFFYMAMCSFMLCASAYQLTSASDPMEIVLTTEYLVFGIAQLFMFCWHSNDVLVKSENLINGPFESQWWTANKRQRKNVLLLTGQFRITQVFTAGPFTELTLSTFVTILKGAYSYYTLLRK